MSCIKIELNKTKMLTWRIEELIKITSMKIVSEIYEIEQTSIGINKHRNHEHLLSSFDFFLFSNFSNFFLFFLFFSDFFWI